MNPSPTVQLFQSTLDSAQLDALENDLRALAEVLAVVPKTSADGMIAYAGTTLREGFAALRAGQLRGLQIRYRHHGEEWWDTLLAHPTGTRLVRRQM